MGEETKLPDVPEVSQIEIGSPVSKFNPDYFKWNVNLESALHIWYYLLNDILHLLQLLYDPSIGWFIEGYIDLRPCRLWLL